MNRQTASRPGSRIGLFGGTFNPIHNGHLQMADKALKEYKLSKVYFIPCGIPPHKKIKDLLPAKLRYKLVKDAIKGKKYFKVLDIEVKKKKPCYTIDTVKTLVGTSRDWSLLYFLIGQDEFENLKTWNKPNELAKLVTFLVLPRSLKKIKPPKIKNLQWSPVHTKLIDISSTEIRRNIKPPHKPR
ncbi:MAG: nicotinate (nicotinamide) nucleotide adenylyltransferase [Candidatus Melainabacteria bacterium RIFCSPHIGHO2_02_FULL_34_12]|nr:MAG: nicotinate (nicotinamide) nucleotide adenylyltransferase [Candidatus Melainabacteria bacterium RIFCSPHIGHO2_02_FULL_34_12]